MKIPEPMMPPITIRAASRVPRRRRSLGEDCCHACISDVLPHDTGEHRGAGAAARAAGPGSYATAARKGPCLDSARMVPKVIAPPVSRATQIVRIDQVLSTATMTPGAVIGFLYTTQDGSTWLGERTTQYMSPANATEINQVLAATHTSTKNVTQFPPESRYGVATKYPQLFAVQHPAGRLRRPAYPARAMRRLAGRAAAPGPRCVSLRPRGACPDPHDHGWQPAHPTARRGGLKTDGVRSTNSSRVSSPTPTFSSTRKVAASWWSSRSRAPTQRACASVATSATWLSAADEPRRCVCGAAPLLQKEIVHGEFAKRVRLPVAIEYEGVAASYEDGLLIVVAPIASTAYMPTARTELHVMVKRTHS